MLSVSCSRIIGFIQHSARRLFARVARRRGTHSAPSLLASLFVLGLVVPLATLRTQDNTAASPAACTPTSCSAPPVRKDINNLSVAELRSLRNGIAAMMRLDVGKATNNLDPIASS